MTTLQNMHHVHCTLQFLVVVLQGSIPLSSSQRFKENAICYRMLWTLTIFILFYFIFLISYQFCFSFFLFLILDDEETHDIVVIWHVTWCDVIGLEHGGNIWKMTSEHMYTTWWSWVRCKANMRIVIAWTYGQTWTRVRVWTSIYCSDNY